MIKVIKKIKIKTDNKDILEIWAGDWINFKALKKCFGIKPNNYTIIELDTNSIDNCKKLWIINIYNEYFNKWILDKIKNKYDIIIITEVLEHQINPKEFFETIYQLLNKNWTIIITVPNRHRFFINNRSLDWDIPPHHFLRFSKKFFIKNFWKNIIYIKDYVFKKGLE